VKAGSAFDDRGLLGEGAASICDDVLQRFDRGDVFVDERFVDQLPQRLGRLQFRRVRRKKNQPHAFGNIQARFTMPACIVEHENDGSITSRAGLAREGFEQRLEERLRDAVMHIPESLACRGRHEGGDIEPVKAVMAKGDRPLADWRPDAPRYGLQAEPMLVACEDFDGPVGVFFRFLDDGVRDFF